MSGLPPRSWFSRSRPSSRVLRLLLLLRGLQLSLCFYVTVLLSVIKHGSKALNRGMILQGRDSLVDSIRFSTWGHQAAVVELRTILLRRIPRKTTGLRKREVRRERKRGRCIHAPQISWAPKIKISCFKMFVGFAFGSVYSGQNAAQLGCQFALLRTSCPCSWYVVSR